MKALILVVVALAAVACGSKKQDKPAEKPVETKTCPAGQVDKDGTCTVIVTQQQVAAVAQQQSRIDELAKLLDQVDTLAAPVDVLNGLRDIDAWKALVASNDKAKLADDLVAQLQNGVKTLRTFKASLGEVQTRVGNLKGELDKLMTQTGAAQKFADVQAQVSAQIKATVEPFAAQVTDTIQNAIVPLSAKLDEVSAVVDIACGTVKLKGGDKAKALCKDAKDAFAKATTFITDFKSKPAALYAELSTTLQSQLEQLVDKETKLALDTAQAKVNDALKLPAAGSAAPAGVAAGSGSAQ
ncbi:MAG TPA: hypothetical protein VFV99_26765 [Kofleriaceae bacterium]|nr:hypothetical protein [Kofleriaceae bacterium]